MASEPVAVDFRDGRYRVHGTVTFRLGSPIERVSGKLQTPIYVVESNLVATEEVQ